VLYLATQTIQQIKAFLQSVKPDVSTVSDDVLIQLVNEVDGSVHYNIFKEQLQTKISLIKDTFEYSLPPGVTFDLIDQVYVNDAPLLKIDESFKDTTGYYKGSTNEKLKIYPVPDVSDETGVTNLVITYLKPFTKYTALTDSVIVNAPHDKIYYEYISAKINLFNENMANYNDMVMIYNASLLDYQAWYEERHTNRRDEQNVANNAAVANGKG
jgi:hypothetical protein